MRILLLSEFYPPILGGLELHVQTLGRALLARGHDVHVATLSGPGEDVHVATPGSVTISIAADAETDPLADTGSSRASADWQFSIVIAPCTNAFTDGPDPISGTSGDDVLCGGGGDDTITGFDGNDQIFAAPVTTT